MNVRLGVLAFAAMNVVGAATTEAQDIVLYSSDVSNVQELVRWESSLRGRRTTHDEQRLWMVDSECLLSQSRRLLEATFNAPSYTTYHVGCGFAQPATEVERLGLAVLTPRTPADRRVPIIGTSDARW